MERLERSVWFGIRNGDPRKEISMCRKARFLKEDKHMQITL
jgi:hypothetical protein